MENKKKMMPRPYNLSDDDIYEAMKKIPGYLDITPGDFKEVYLHAFTHAIERLFHSIKARDIMTRNVVSVTGQTTLKEVAQIMAYHEISGVPVVDEKNYVIGVISEKDFLSRISEQKITTIMGVLAECLMNRGCLVVSIRDGQAQDIMSCPAITVQEDTQLIEISRLFIEKVINRVPVVTPEGCLTGIISRGDIIRTSFQLGESI